MPLCRDCILLYADADNTLGVVSCGSSVLGNSLSLSLSQDKGKWLHQLYPHNSSCSSCTDAPGFSTGSTERWLHFPEISSNTLHWSQCRLHFLYTGAANQYSSGSFNVLTDHHILDDLQGYFSAKFFFIYNRFSLLQEFIIKKMSKGKEVLKYGKAEVKIMFSFCYYILLGGLVLGVFSYYVGINERIITDQQTFFICESFGVNAGNDCEAVRSTSNTILSELALVAIVLQGLGLLVILVFIVDCKCKRTASKKVRDKTI